MSGLGRGSERRTPCLGFVFIQGRRWRTKGREREWHRSKNVEDIILGPGRQEWNVL